MIGLTRALTLAVAITGKLILTDCEYSVQYRQHAAQDFASSCSGLGPVASLRIQVFALNTDN